MFSYRRVPPAQGWRLPFTTHELRIFCPTLRSPRSGVTACDKNATEICHTGRFLSHGQFRHGVESDAEPYPNLSGFPPSSGSHPFFFAAQLA